MQNGFHPHPPRNLSPNHDFMGVLYTVVVGKAWTMFFFFFCLLCVRVRDNCSLKTVHIFYGIPDLRTPTPPPPCLKKKIKIQNSKNSKEGKKGKPITGLSALKSVFRFRVVRSEFQKSKSRFPNRIRRPFYL